MFSSDLFRVVWFNGHFILKLLSLAVTSWFFEYFNNKDSLFKTVIDFYI